MACCSTFSPCEYSARQTVKQLATPSTVTHHTHSTRKLAERCVHKIRDRAATRWYARAIRPEFRNCIEAVSACSRCLVEICTRHTTTMFCSMRAITAWIMSSGCFRYKHKSNERKDTANGGNARRRRRRRLCLGLFVAYFNLHNLAMKNNGFNNVHATHASYMGLLSFGCFAQMTSANIFESRVFFFSAAPTPSRSSISTWQWDRALVLNGALCITVVRLHVWGSPWRKKKIWNSLRVHLWLHNILMSCE